MLSIKKATETVPAKAFCLDFISESTAGTAYPVTSYHLPFIIYHCNSSFNLVSADKAAVISEHTSKSFLGAEVVSQRKTAFGFARPVCRLSKQSELSQPPNQDPQHPQPSNKSQSDNYFPGLSNAFCSFFFCPDPIESSRPLILSLHEAHTLSKCS